MSYVAPVTAVFVMRWTASAAMSAGPTTRRIGSLVRSCSRRASSWSPGGAAASGGADDAPDRQPRAELLATRVQLVAEERRRQRRVDEPGRDQVHADGRELEREVLGQRGKRGGE